MEPDRKQLFDQLGGETAVAAMNPEAKADALEEHMQELLNQALGGYVPGTPYPKAADIESRIETRRHRRGVGDLFLSYHGNVQRLPEMPEAPTLQDFFQLRFLATANHCLQSANLALKTGMTEEIVLACLLHDTVQALIKVDHGWWGAQIYEPYVSEKVSFAIRHHQTLRFYEDKAAGYEYPELYRIMFGEDYKPEPYIQKNYEFVRNHKWYDLPRMVTVNDLYAFDTHTKVSIDPFLDIIGRHFKQPKEGLGFDGSPVAHMWRSIIMPDRPL